MGSKRNQEPVSPTNWQLRNAVFAAAFAVLVSFAYCVVRGVGLPSGKAASNHVELKSEVGTSPSTSLNVEWEQIGRRACGIKYASHFLSEAEVDHILRVIDESGGFVAGSCSPQRSVIKEPAHILLRIVAAGGKPAPQAGQSLSCRET